MKNTTNTYVLITLLLTSCLYTSCVTSVNLMDAQGPGKNKHYVEFSTNVGGGFSVKDSSDPIKSPSITPNVMFNIRYEYGISKRWNAMMHATGLSLLTPSIRYQYLDVKNLDLSLGFGLQSNTLYQLRYNSKNQNINERIQHRIRPELTFYATKRTKNYNFLCNLSMTSINLIEPDFQNLQACLTLGIQRELEEYIQVKYGLSFIYDKHFQRGIYSTIPYSMGNYQQMGNIVFSCAVAGLINPPPRKKKPKHEAPRKNKPKSFKL